MVGALSSRMSTSFGAKSAHLLPCPSTSLADFLSHSAGL